MTQAKRHYNQGVSLYDSGEYQKAIDEFSQTIELDPKYVWAYNNRGSSYHKLGEYERAIEDFDEAVELEPQYPWTYYIRGHSYALSLIHI